MKFRKCRIIKYGRRPCAQSSYPLLITVEIILNCSLALMQCGECAGMTMPFPNLSWYFFSSMMTSAAPSIICIYVSKGEVFSPNSSPVAKDATVILPVVFLIIVLLTTAFGTYSMISTMICAFDFSTSAGA